jgi:hypothetical protein
MHCTGTLLRPCKLKTWCGEASAEEDVYGPPADPTRDAYENAPDPDPAAEAATMSPKRRCRSNLRRQTADAHVHARRRRRRLQ